MCSVCCAVAKLKINPKLKAIVVDSGQSVPTLRQIWLSGLQENVFGGWFLQGSMATKRMPGIFFGHGCGDDLQPCDDHGTVKCLSKVCHEDKLCNHQGCDKQACNNAPNTKPAIKM